MDVVVILDISSVSLINLSEELSQPLKVELGHRGFIDSAALEHRHGQSAQGVFAAYDLYKLVNVESNIFYLLQLLVVLFNLVNHCF